MPIATPAKTIRLILPDHTPDPAFWIDLFRRAVSERCPVQVVLDGEADFTVELALQEGGGPEGFAIADRAAGGVQIASRDRPGLLPGLGKFLHTSTYSQEGFTASAWRGVSQPQGKVRGIYFATHFHNWYHVAPLAEIEQYVQELALWGVNTVSVWFDMHHFDGLHDPQAQAMLARLSAILQAARRAGMQTSATFLANEGYASSPQALRADWSAGHDGYHHEPLGHYHVELCPSQPGGTELILRWAEEKLLAFAPVGLDYLWIWPYDQGGCTCARCAPWGANGFLRIAEPLARLYRRLVPQGKVILSTWYFDHFTDGEWSGLGLAFQQPPDWADYLLADDYGDQFPAYPLQHGAPGGLPLVNFPEISMYRCGPWGGFGANPLPRHLEAVWRQAARLVSGGFPYSEGIFEDFNKVLFAQWFWQPDRPASEIADEYTNYEFGAAAVIPLREALAILEQNHPRRVEGERVICESLQDCERAWQLIQQVEAEMPPAQRQSWRWQMLALRARIDFELSRTGGWLRGAALQEAFAAVTRLSHAENALPEALRPPVVNVVE